jgi:N4-gp56 family major capsid protein
MPTWTTAGGFMATPTLSEVLRHSVQPLVRFRQFCDIEEALGKEVGDTFQWNIYGDAIADGAALVEGSAMPETDYAITQASVVMTEYGIAVPYTGKFDDLSEHPVRNIIHKTLKNAARRSLDTAAHAQFDSTNLLVKADSGSSATDIEFTDDGVPIAGGLNAVALTISHVKAISDLMQERNIPVFDGENYIAVARPSTLRPMRNELEQIHQYVDPGWMRIMAGEIGRYEGIRMVTQTNIPDAAWAGLSDDAYFFGADTVTEACAIPEEVRGKIPDDYGRGKGIAWYAILGFAITHADTTSAETRAQARIVKWSEGAA